MKKTAFLLSALLAACAGDASEVADESADQSEVLEQSVQKTVSWSLQGPNKSKQEPKDDFAATLVCHNDGKGHAMAQIVLRNVKQKANYYGSVSLTMNGKKANGAVGGTSKTFQNVELPVNGRSYPLTLISGNLVECTSMAATLSITWIEPV